MNEFTESYPAFSAYVVIGGYDTEDDMNDDSFTVRLFTSNFNAVDYGRSLLLGTDEWACTDNRKYDYARVHTMGNDGRLSPNSYYVSLP